MNLRSLQWPVLRSVQKWPAMRDEYREWVAAGLLKDGKSKGGLADALGVHQSQITRLLDGKRQIKVEEVPLIASYLEEPPPGARERALSSEDVAASLDRPPKRLVPVKGYVGAGSQAHYYAVDPGDLGEIDGGELATDQSVALVIIGSSLGKFFDRWHVLYDDVRSPVTDDLIGELCVVGLPDDRIVVKKIKRNGRRYDLISNVDSEPPIENVNIEWAAKVKNLVRG